MNQDSFKNNRNEKLWNAFRKYQSDGGLTQAAFAEKFGLRSVSNLSQYLHGLRPLNFSAALSFARGMRVPLVSILDDSSVRLINELHESLGKTSDDYQRGGRGIEIYDMNQILFRQKGFKCSSEALIHADYEANSNLAACRIATDDMAPQVRCGDILIIDFDRKPRPGNMVVGSIANRPEAVVRNYSVIGIDSNGEDVFRLTPANPVYPILSSDSVELNVLGVVVEQRMFF